MAGQAMMGRSLELGDYIVGKKLGSGGFGVVWYGLHRVHGTEVAIKEMETQRLDPMSLENLKFEIRILSGVNHPNIVRLYDVIEVPGKIYLVLEYCNRGDLSSYIKSHGRLPEATAKYFMQQLATGLKVLRNCDVIHRDLKPENLLLSRNGEKLLLKIADFGIARFLPPWGHTGTICGTLLYMAPEIMCGQPYDAKADLWSVGAILFELVTGTPFTNREMPVPHYNPSLSPECNDLCQRLLQPNPEKRLTYEGFFNHPFLSQRRPEWNEPSRKALRIYPFYGFLLAGIIFLVCWYRNPPRFVGGLAEPDPSNEMREIVFPWSPWDL